jgi:hypothetical protein
MGRALVADRGSKYRIITERSMMPSLLPAEQFLEQRQKATTHLVRGDARADQMSLQS